MQAAIAAIGGLTLLSGIAVAGLMRETLPARPLSAEAAPVEGAITTLEAKRTAR